MEQTIILEILEAYKTKESVKSICKRFAISTNTLSKYVDEANIPKRAKKQQIKKDLSKFKDLDNPELQYWIGYICADGSIQYSTEKRVYKVSLYSKDDEVVEKFKDFFGEIVSIHYRKNSNMKEAYINSKELCEYFINELNITPSKAFTIMPNIEFSSNFILGYFDGDGCITNSTEKRIRYEAKFTSGNKNFLLKIQDKLNEVNIYSSFREKGNAFDLCIDRMEESEKLYKFLYKDVVVCLSRKLNNFVALFGNL